MDNILALHGLISGLKATDKQSLIDIVNNAEANENTVKTNIANALNSVSKDASLGLSNLSTWIDILNAIPNIKTGKKWASGTQQNTGDLIVTGLSFNPSMVFYYMSSPVNSNYYMGIGLGFNSKRIRRNSNYVSNLFISQSASNAFVDRYKDELNFNNGFSVYTDNYYTATYYWYAFE